MGNKLVTKRTIFTKTFSHTNNIAPQPKDSDCFFGLSFISLGELLDPH